MHESIEGAAAQGPWATATSFRMDRDPVLWKQECRDLLDETLERLRYVEGIVNADIDTAWAMNELATVMGQIQRVGLLVLEHRLRDCIAEVSAGPEEAKVQALQEWTRALERFVHTLG